MTKNFHWDQINNLREISHKRKQILCERTNSSQNSINNPRNSHGHFTQALATPPAKHASHILQTIINNNNNNNNNSNDDNDDDDVARRNKSDGGSGGGCGRS